MASPHAAVVLDDTALMALGAGNQMMSRLVIAADGQPGRFVFAPAMCVAAAVGRRPRLGNHVGSLLAIQILELGFAAATAVGTLIAAGTAWSSAHAVTAARASIEWPAGLPVVTTTPQVYEGHGLRVIDLN